MRQPGTCREPARKGAREINLERAAPAFGQRPAAADCARLIGICSADIDRARGASHLDVILSAKTARVIAQRACVDEDGLAGGAEIVTRCGRERAILDGRITVVDRVGCTKSQGSCSQLGQALCAI